MSQTGNMRARNLEAFRSLSPELADQLTAYQPVGRLVAAPGGGWDVEIGGNLVFGGKAQADTENRLQQFLKSPTRHFLIPPHKGGLVDGHTETFMSRFLERTGEAGMSFTYRHQTDKAFFLIVFGVGLEPQFDRLIDATDCNHLTVVEPNLEVLCHTLQIFDWQALIGRVTAKGGNVNFVIDDDPSSLSRTLPYVMRATNPCGVDGFTYFSTYGSQVPPKTLATIDAEGLTLSQLGFFYDNLIMLTNAYGNLKDGRARVINRPKVRKIDVPLFIVGSGPSLDNDLAFIADNADKAVIVSLGSAMRPLMKSGIKSDFQIESENIYLLLDLVPMSEEFDLSGVWLLAASTIEKGVSDFYDDTVYYFRTGLCSFPLFCSTDKSALRFPDPTVGNSGLSFAQDMGFRNIYFFGIDMGWKGTGTDHAKDHYHNMEGSLPNDQIYNIPLEGNFGGRCFTSADLHLTLVGLQKAIAENRDGYTYVNCSDGCRIAGTEPHRSAELELPKPSMSKEKALLTVRDANGAPVYSSDKFARHWRPDEIEAAVTKYLDGLAEEISGVADFADKRYLLEFMKRLQPALGSLQTPPPGIKNAVTMLFHGTAIMMLIVLEYYRNRVSDPAHIKSFEEIAKEEFVRALEGMRETTLGVLANPDAPIPDMAAKGEEITGVAMADEDPEIEKLVTGAVRYDDPASWGRVPRNANCPCGSGKKFKHCHGRIA